MIDHGLNPYNSKIKLTSEEAEEIVETVFEDRGFQDTDALDFHGGPSKRNEIKRLEIFEETADYLQSTGRTPELYFPENKEYLLDNSDVESDRIIVISPEITEEDISKSGTHESRVHVTSDYHSERVDRLLNEYEEDQDHDYLVLGAYTGDLDSLTEVEIGGKTLPVTHGLREVMKLDENYREADFNDILPVASHQVCYRFQ